MGSLCSKPDVHSGGTQVLGRSSGAVPTSRPAPANGADARAARAEAAEQRLKAIQARGVTSSNPKSGKLAAQAAKPISKTPEAAQEQRLVWD
ncbi:hypothetical protein CPB85DRAFT_1267959 [Mucidula mucida]|nr:hypothetical protein CPB85DRAFT_1267959 [Mucidula mucida]